MKSIRPMSKPELDQSLLKEVMVFGASGTLGDGILKALLKDIYVEKIHVITRRETPRIQEGVKQGKVIVTIHKNYLDYTPIEDKLLNTKTVYWALGTSSANVSDEEYTKIHVDFPVNFVKLWLSLQKEKQLSFHLITGAGTSTDSWFHWAREKAQAELQLKALTDKTELKFIAYRPGAVKPTAERSNFFHHLFYPLLGAIKATHIGQCMIEVSMRPKEVENGSIINHSSMKDFAEKYREHYQLPD